MRESTEGEVRLHSYWSSNPMKIQWALEELGLAHELVEVDLGTQAQQTEAFARLHPRQKVPVLEADGGVFWESGAALLHLARTTGRLWPTDAAAESTALSLLFMESSAFQDKAGITFWERVIRPAFGGGTNEARIAEAKPELDKLLAILSAQLGEGDYLMGDFSLLDCAYGPWCTVLDLDDFPSLVAWRARFRARPAFVRCGFRY